MEFCDLLVLIISVRDTNDFLTDKYYEHMVIKGIKNDSGIRHYHFLFHENRDEDKNHYGIIQVAFQICRVNKNYFLERFYNYDVSKYAMRYHFMGQTTCNIQFMTAI